MTCVHSLSYEPHGRSGAPNGRGPRFLEPAEPAIATPLHAMKQTVCERIRLYSGYKRRLVKMLRKNQYIGGNGVKNDECMGVSQLFGGTCLGCPPQVYAYEHCKHLSPDMIPYSWYHRPSVSNQSVALQTPPVKLLLLFSVHCFFDFSIEINLSISSLVYHCYPVRRHILIPLMKLSVL